VKKILISVLLSFVLFASYSYVANQRLSLEWLEAENLVGVLLNPTPEVGSIFGGPDPINNKPDGSIFGGAEPINNKPDGSIFGGPDPINNFLPDWVETSEPRPIPAPITTLTPPTNTPVPPYPAP